jgi:ABC-type microcin C transport system permease subunit YejE
MYVSVHIATGFGWLVKERKKYKKEKVSFGSFILYASEQNRRNEIEMRRNKNSPSQQRKVSKVISVSQFRPVCTFTIYTYKATLLFYFNISNSSFAFKQ